MLPMQLVESLLDDQLLALEAQRRGLDVTPAEIDAAIRSQFAGPIGAEAERFPRQYAMMVQLTGFADAEYRAATAGVLAANILESQLAAV